MSATRGRLHSLTSALVSMLLLATVTGQTQEPGRTQAVQSLSSSDPQARRAAAARLSEVGTMADVPLLVRELRDPDEDARGEAEQAIWHIWSRSGDPEVDSLYETGIGQMNAGELQHARSLMVSVFERGYRYIEAASLQRERGEDPDCARAQHERARRIETEEIEMCALRRFYGLFHRA